MNKILLQGLLSAILATSGSALYAQTPWQGLGPNSGMVNGSSDYSSIAVDTNKVAFVAYSDISDNSKLKIKKFNGTTWEAVGTNASDNGSLYIVMKIDKENKPCVLFRDGFKLTLKRFDGSVWTTVGNAQFTPGNCALPDLSFGPDNTPYVSFVNFATGANGKATVMKYDGTSWVLLGSPMSSGEAGSTQIEVSASGVVYCGYTDNAQGGWVNVKKFDNNAWVAVGGAVNSSNAKNLSLELKSNGTPVVGYSDAAAIEKMSVKEFNGTAWTNIGPAGFSVSQVGEAGYTLQYKYAAMVMGKDDQPIVGFTDLDSAYKMTVMKYNGTSWSVLGMRPVASQRAKCVELAVDKGNTVYGAYTSSPPGNSGPWPNYVVKLDLCETLQGVTASAGNVCYGDPVTLTVTGNLGTASGWQWTSGSCGGTSVGTGNSLTVTPTSNTTYYVKAIDGCSSSCESVAVEVTHLEPVVSHQANNGTYTLSVSGGPFATYQWYRNGSAIAGATNATYETTILAVYAVSVTGGDCTVSSADYNLSQQVSIKEQAAFAKQVKLFPNPATAQLNIAVPATVNIQVVSVEGRTIQRRELQQGDNKINVAAFAAGTYMIHFVDKNGNRITTYPFVKQ